MQDRILKRAFLAILLGLESQIVDIGIAKKMTGTGMIKNTKTVFYKKVGRRYQPVSEYDNELLDSFTKGTHLVMCYPGGTSRRFDVNPDYAAMIAAGRVAEDAISKKIMEKSALRVPEKNKPLTPEQKAAWEHLAETFGEERYALEYCSYREAAEAGITAMMEEAEKLMENPAVRKAWDQFQLICALTKQQESAH